MAVMLLEWAFTSAFLILVVSALRAALGRRMSAGLRYALWAVVLVRLLVPVQLFTSPIAGTWVMTEERTERDAAAWPIADGARDTAGPDDVLTLDAPALLEGQTAFPKAPDPPAVPDVPEAPDLGDLPGWVAYLGWAWLAGSIAAALVLLTSNLRFYRRLRQERIPLDEAGGPPRVYVVTGLPSPCLFGAIRPAVYVTPEAAADPDMLRHVLAHEHTHYRHGDHIWSLLRCAALAVHWWDPLVWAAAVLSQRDAELACDEGALKRLGDGERAGYGNTLLALVTAKPRPGDLFRCATTMAGDKKSLKERIGRIACAPKRVVWAVVMAVLVTALACVCAFGQAAEPVEEPEPDPAPSSGPEQLGQGGDYPLGYGQLAFDLSWGDDLKEARIELPEYPGVVFLWTPGEVTAIAEDRERTLFSGMPIWDIYVCDLTGDGKRELCSCISLGSGVIDERIYVYDYAEQVLYELQDRMVYDYSLRLEGERLWAVERDYDASGINRDGEERRAGPLVLTERGLEIQAPMDAPYTADLDRDGVPEELRVVDMDEGMGQRLEVWEDGETIFSEEGYHAHAGYDALFLYRDGDGQDYLLRYRPYMGQGWCTYSYQLFTLEGGQETVVKESTVEFDIDFQPLQHESFDPEAIAAFVEEIDELLSHSVQLLNTDQDLLDTFEKEGRLHDSLGWLDWWEPTFVRDESKSLLENLREFQTAMEAWYAGDPDLSP